MKQIHRWLSDHPAGFYIGSAVIACLAFCTYTRLIGPYVDFYLYGFLFFLSVFLLSALVAAAMRSTP